MTGAPLVSVVVPAFNAERFLAEALDSVLAQSHTPLEVIVVDDGSTDRTGEIARSYGVHCLRQRNSGHAAARNAGVTAAGGDFLSFLDADDLWEPNKLSTEVTHLLAHPELGFLRSSMWRTLAPGAKWPPGTPRKWFLEPQPGNLSSAALIRRSAFEHVGPFDPSFQHGDDGDWVARAADAGIRSEVIPDVLVHYRIHGANQHYDNKAMKAELFELLRSSVRRKQGPGSKSGAA
jgi:glycosyltransferase involved in cell wall biosynthesis